MGYRESMRSAGGWIACVIAATIAVFVLHVAVAPSAYAAQGSADQLVAAATVQVKAQIVGEGSAEVTTGDTGDAYVQLDIARAGVYSIMSTSSSGVDGDTIGYLYDDLMNQLDESDDRHADANFAITANLASGTYYLKVTGKECQENAFITVAVVQKPALNSLDCRVEYAGDAVSSFELGTWVQGEKTEWVKADAASYKAIGYVDRSVFIHAQESGSVPMLAWKTGLPTQQGRFVVMAEAVGANNGMYTGSAYYNLDAKVNANSISELDPEVSTTVCNAISAVELGKYTTVPTNWSSRWDAITAGYYEVVGYCTRGRFEVLGGDEASIPWTPGLPREVGEYVIKCTATKVAESPYTGSCYVWASIDELGHAGSGSWIVDKEATFTEAGQRHLTCAYCGAPCDYETIPALKGTVETAGSGATLADYKFLSTKTVSYERCLTAKAKAVVPDTITIDGARYDVVSVAPKAFASNTKLTSVTIGKNVTSIGSQAFKGCKKAKTLTVQSTGLTAAGIKNCLKGSSVTTVKVPQAKKADYAKLFVKKVCGANVTVK